MCQKQGFTLIELLVVVLIIGILAAVALPQYQVAVAKSRIAGLVTFGRSLQNAQKLFYMANGSYATDFTLLDVSCETSPDKPTLCSLSSKQTASIKDNYIVVTDARVPKIMLIFFFSGRANCMAYGGDFSEKVCKSVSGTDQFTSNIYGGSKYYKLWD